MVIIKIWSHHSTTLRSIFNSVTCLSSCQNEKNTKHILSVTTCFKSSFIIPNDSQSILLLPSNLCRRTLSWESLRTKASFTLNIHKIGNKSRAFDRKNISFFMPYFANVKKMKKVFLPSNSIVSSKANNMPCN